MADLETTDRTNNAFDGWNSEYINTTHFEIVENDARTSLRNFINYIYLDLLSREVSDKEFNMFYNHFISDDNETLRYEFDLIAIRDDNQELGRFNARKAIAQIVFDFISRLDELYIVKKLGNSNDE
jgi:hypothetical protein